MQISLWTFHRTGFDLTKGVIDHTLSAYSDMPHYLDHVKALAQELETNQFVWCFNNSNINNWGRTSIPYIRYSLCVPEEEILACIDNEVWHQILDSLDSRPLSADERLKLFDVLRTPGPRAPNTTVLIRFPILKPWIIDSEPWLTWSCMPKSHKPLRKMKRA